jgi:cyclophilin family peptidyl-prolyl cis-trans isomerase
MRFYLGVALLALLWAPLAAVAQDDEKKEPAEKPAAEKPADDKEEPADTPKQDEAGKDEAKKDETKKDDAPKKEQPDQPASGEKPAEKKPAADEKPAPKQAEKPAAEKPAAEKPAADKPAADKPVAEKPANPPAAGSFDAQFAEWKQLLARLREIQGKWQVAMPDEKKKLEAEFDELVAQGEKMAPELKKSAETTFQADPANEAAGQFVAVMASDAKNNDNYEEAARLAALLLDKGYQGAGAKDLKDLAGVASFEIADFDAAEKYLNQAKEEQTISSTGEGYLAEIPQYREYWKKEQELRKAEAEADDLPRVQLKTTKGDIVIELFENEAPNTVANFINLVESDFYNGLAFHRVLAGFMAQGGDPKGDGSGGPGYTIECECDQENHRIHFRGSLSMAHAGKDTGGSQFFLTFRPTSHLNGKHTVFGRVIEGTEILSKLQRRDPTAPNPPEADKILEAKVLRKRDHEYKVVKKEDK